MKERTSRKERRKALYHVTLTFCTLTRFPDTDTGGTEKVIKIYSDTICRGRNFTWTGSRNNLWVQLTMLDKYGQEGELTSLWFSKILIIIEESEKKICLSCLEGEYYPLFQCWQTLPWAKTDRVFLTYLRWEVGKGYFWKSPKQSNKG